ncbi:MAG: hypothetical protein PUF07_02270 [Bacteroidales bacterium]|nr:hypothetical protein [Bacteroidales bacterium]
MMKNFYSFLKGLMAAMLLCLGVLTPNAANAANGIQGVQGVSAYTADDLVGLWTAAYDWSSEGTKYNPSAAPMSLEFVKEGDALKLKGFGESEVVLNVTVTATGIQLEPMMTIGAKGNYIFGTDDNGDTAVTFTQEADGSLKMSSEEGYFECPSDDFWFKNIVMTKVSGGASGGSFDHAPAELAGYYLFNTNPWTVTSPDPEAPADASMFPTEFIAKVTVGEDGKVYMTQFVGTPSVIYYGMDDVPTVAESAYVGTWSDADKTVTFEWPAAHAEGGDYSFYMARDRNGMPWKLKDPIVMNFTTWGTRKYLNSDEAVSFDCSISGAEATVTGVSATVYTPADVALEDLAGHWQLNGGKLNDDGDIATGSIEFDIVKKDDGSLVLTNLAGDNYEFPIQTTDLGFSIAITTPDVAGKYLLLSGDLYMGKNVEFTVKTKKQITLASKHLYFENEAAFAWMFQDAVGTKVPVEPAFDPAPAGLAGRYDITVGGYQSENVVTDNLPTTFKGEISIDERGRLRMVGLIGTPSYSKQEGWSSVQVDTCYVGYYNAEAKTVTFYYPENDEDQWIFYDMDLNDTSWECTAPFTMNVVEDGEGNYSLTTDGDIQFVVGWNYEPCTMKGATFTKRKVYTMTDDDLVGKWNFNFIYLNEDYNYVEEQGSLNFNKREDGSWYMTGIPGDKTEIEVNFDGQNIVIPAIFDEVDEDGDESTYDDCYYHILWGSLQSDEDVVFSVGENKTLVLESDMIYFSNLTEEDVWLAPCSGIHAPVELSPAPGHYATMPNEFVLRTNKYDIASVDAVGYRTQGSFRTTMLDESAYVVAGDSIKVTLPISADDNIASLVLVIQVKDAKGNDVLYGDETPSNSFIYTADVPHNTFAIVGVTPDAAEAQASLTELAVLLESPLQFDGVGGFDATKVVTLKNAAGEDAATCTLDFDPEQFISNKAIVKLSAPVTEAGQYTLTVPEGAIYNLVYDDEKEDLGLADGAIYNPEFTVTFTVDPTVGIVNVEVSNAAGERIYNLQGVKMQKAQRGVNIVNGKKVLVK